MKMLLCYWKSACLYFFTVIYLLSTSFRYIPYNQVVDCRVCGDPHSVLQFVEIQFPPDKLVMKYQYLSDLFIALAYFSIPMELIYFVYKSVFFPYRWVLMQFGAFIVLCGTTHMINLWTYTMHSKTLAISMVVAKVAYAGVSCVTSLMLVHIIPDLLSVKTCKNVDS